MGSTGLRAAVYVWDLICAGHENLRLLKETSNLWEDNQSCNRERAIVQKASWAEMELRPILTLNPN